MEFYNVIMNVVNTADCSFDEAFVWCTCALMVFFVLVGWAIGLCVEFGINLYLVTKAAFRFIRRNVAKLLRRFRRL